VDACKRDLAVHHYHEISSLSPIRRPAAHRLLPCEGVKPNTGFRWIPPRIPPTKYSASSLHLFILNLPRQGGNRSASLPCNFRSFSPASSHHPLHPSITAAAASSPLLLSLPPPRCLVLSQQPAATLPSVTLHYLPLRNVEDASFHSGARKISSAVSSASRQRLGAHEIRRRS